MAYAHAGFLSLWPDSHHLTTPWTKCILWLHGLRTYRGMWY